MTANDIGAEWKVAWARPRPNKDGHFENLVLTHEEAIQYGDELVQSLLIDEGILQEWSLNPEEPFAWTIEDGEIATKQISRGTFETVAESDKDDSVYAKKVIEYRA